MASVDAAGAAAEPDKVAVVMPRPDDGETPVAAGEAERRLHTAVSMTFQKAMADPDSEAYNHDHGRGTALGFFAYATAVFMIAAAFSAISVGFWSEMGCGKRCLDTLRSVEGLAPVCMAAGVGIVLLLSVFDFFNPPHLHGKYMLLWEGDRFVGRGLLAVAVVSFVASAYLIAHKYPTVPLLVSIFLSPLCVLIFRYATTPKDLLVYAMEAPDGDVAAQAGAPAPSASTPAEAPERAEEEAFEQRMQQLRHLTGDAADEQCFYKAAACAFATVGAICIFAYTLWIRTQPLDDKASEEDQSLDLVDKELRFIRFAAPVTVAVSNFLFAGLMGLRVLLHRVYAQTHEARNRLVVEAASRSLGQEIMKFRMAALTEAGSLVGETSETAAARMKEKIEEYLVQQSSSTQRLTNVIKFLNVALLVIVGGVLLTMQCALGDSPFATFTQGFVAAFAIIFGAFVAVAFSRIRHHLSAWLRDMPLWKTAVAMTSQSPARAAFLVFLLPVSPLILALADVNQSIRRCRGIASKTNTWYGRIFGRRAEDLVGNMCTWDWLSVVVWTYVWSLLVICLKATPVFLNILLAWLYDAMADWHFGVVVGMTWAVGMFLFMLPPVPGPPIYLFGGLLITSKCPWGFWWGAGINVAMSFVLKLTACSVQQKLIGGYLSKSLWVRKTCGVHTPLMRAIESALSKPGLSPGKVMILCGGPDWPTSVLAGILRISLVQCLIGTIPIIFAVAPLGLSGSFYNKAGEDEVWQRLSNFMLILSSLITMGFWGGCAWAVQEEFVKNQEKLTMPREEFVDLEWLSYLSARVNERCQVKWADVPLGVRLPFVGGMLGVMFASSAFLWCMKNCMGMFEVDADIDTLRWFGQEGILRPLGVFALGLAFVSLSGMVVYKAWQVKFTYGPRENARQRIMTEEVAWKTYRRQEAREAEQRSTLTAPTLQDLTEQCLRQNLSMEGDVEKAPCTSAGSKKGDASHEHAAEGIATAFAQELATVIES